MKQSDRLKVGIEKGLLSGMEFAKHHHESEFIDEIKVRVVPRFKESELSGCEWRRHAQVTLLHKGEVVLEIGYGDVDTAAVGIPWLLRTLYEHEFTHPDPNNEKCFQPGCAEKGTVKLYLKHEYAQGHELPDKGFKLYRRFCLEHSERGDSDFEDCDANYEIAHEIPKAEKSGHDHHTLVICDGCGNRITCRCAAPKVESHVPTCERCKKP